MGTKIKHLRKIPTAAVCAMTALATCALLSALCAFLVNQKMLSEEMISKIGPMILGIIVLITAIAAGKGTPQNKLLAQGIGTIAVTVIAFVLHEIFFHQAPLRLTASLLPIAVGFVLSVLINNKKRKRSY